jgi:HAD superfamily phosphoserine phosphatase-like hydrolase
MVKAMNGKHTRRFLLASDFDQTLSYNDSGLELSELLGVAGFEQKVAGLAQSHLVQQGGELAYLIRHDPQFRGVRREHLVEAGKRVRLKGSLPAFVEFLARGVDGNEFDFYVISAAPREVVVSALEGIVPQENIFGTEFDFDPQSGEVHAINRVRAGYGKVAVLEELGQRLGITPDRTIYVGDGSSDIHVMLHVNNGDGFTIAVSENRQLARIAKSTVLSDSASSVLLPILDQVLGLRTAEIRAHLESTGLMLGEWQRARTDRVQIRELAAATSCG